MIFQKLLNLFYRIIAPKHPRGWLDFHAVEEKDKVWVHCHGMEKWNLPNIEFVDVPIELSGYAHGIAMALTDYLKNVKKINSGEHIGGAFISEDQAVIHRATLHQIDRPDDKIHSGFLRVVDYEENKEKGFPYKLFAAHLIGIAGQQKNPNEAIKLFEKAIKIFPGEFENSAEGIDSSFEFGTNQNNFFAYNGIGDVYADLGDFEKAKTYFETAIAKCPSWANNWAISLRGSFGDELPEESKNDPRFQYWKSIDQETIKEIISKRSK